MKIKEFDDDDTIQERFVFVVNRISHWSHFSLTLECHIENKGTIVTSINSKIFKIDRVFIFVFINNLFQFYRKIKTRIIKLNNGEISKVISGAVCRNSIDSHSDHSEWITSTKNITG